LPITAFVRLCISFLEHSIVPGISLLIISYGKANEGKICVHYISRNEKDKNEEKKETIVTNISLIVKQRGVKCGLNAESNPLRHISNSRESSVRRN
jgi:hypothetical protein